MALWIETALIYLTAIIEKNLLLFLHDAKYRNGIS